MADFRKEDRYDGSRLDTASVDQPGAAQNEAAPNDCYDEDQKISIGSFITFIPHLAEACQTSTLSQVKSRQFTTSRFVRAKPQGIIGLN
jgi:hypothetical protein